MPCSTIPVVRDMFRTAFATCVWMLRTRSEISPVDSALTVALLASSLFAANEGYLNDIEPAKVRDFEDALHAYMNANQADLMATINETGDYSDAIESRLRAALDDFNEKGKLFILW